MAIKKKHNPQYKQCLSCSLESNKKLISNFYQTKNPDFNDGRIPFCKECIKKKCYNKATNSINIEELKEFLKRSNLPYINSVMESSIKQHEKSEVVSRAGIIGIYFKNISLKQYRDLKWQDGLIMNQNEFKKEGLLSDMDDDSIYAYTQNSNSASSMDDRVFSIKNYESFHVSEEMIELFGSGYKKSEYKDMWDKYNFIKKSYPERSNLHTEALINYVRFKVKEEQATAAGDAKNADEWGSMATKAADKAKINPSQLTQGDLQGGVNSFSELIMAVEESEDIIPILPQFKYRPQDSPDFTIWCYINYIRALEGNSLVDYFDIYKFYDERKSAYIEQYGDPNGIFTEDTSIENRDKIEKFITLPKDVEGVG